MESAHLLPAFSPETLGSQVLQRFSIYEPGGPDEARKWTSQMETLQSLGIVTMARGLTEENRSYGYLNPLEDPHIAAMAKGTDRSARQVIDRWWLQLGGMLLVEDHLEEHWAALEGAFEESQMRRLNGLASLAASSPGRRAPVWCEDVYHLSELPLET